MDFCKGCGALMRGREGDLLSCSCGRTQSPASSIINEKVERPSDLQVVDRQINPLAVYEHACARCGYAKAEILTKGTIVTDEDEFFLYKCGKCGFTERAEGLKVT